MPATPGCTTRVTGEKDLVRLPGLVAIAYQHETVARGDPHLHTHVIVPNRQARADGKLVSIDGDVAVSRGPRRRGRFIRPRCAANCTARWESSGRPVDPSTGMAELAGVDRATITAWSRRSTQLREWAADNLNVVDGPVSAAPAGGRAESDAPGQTRRAGLGAVVGAVARR